MNDKKNKRIGVFEYDWSMYSFIKDFCIKLAEAGYSVDIFYKDWDIGPDCTNTDDFKCYQNIRFFNFTTKATRRQVIRRGLTRLLNKLAMFFSFPHNERPHKIINRQILDKSKEIIGPSQYYCFIGIEKKGLIWAGILSEMYHCPVIYHSLELYIEDNPVIDRVYHLLDTERKYHKLAIATIIQDELRGNVLLKSNKIEQANVLYFPISVKGKVIREKSKYLQDKFSIGDDKKILLYFGSLDETRCTTQTVNMASYLDDDVILVVHGWGPKRYLDYLQSIADKNKVVFSLDFLPEDEITSMVSSSHIGISIYETRNFNDRLVAFSSSKMAYYTQCGIPMIAFDTESFRELESSYRCIELIAAIDETPQKVRKILGNYDLYRQEAYSAYQRFYSLDENFSKLICNLESIINGAQPVIESNDKGA
jgi:glycosyltransferase involved in cell wall biosynthesis